MTLLRDRGYLRVEERPVSVDEVVSAARSGRLQEAFGMGTAAVISQINVFGYRGEDFRVPTPEDGYAMRIKKELTDIRMGRVEDPYGWMTVI